MNEIWNLINEMSPYLLLGFGFAGILHAFVPARIYRRYLGKADFRSVLWAALIGDVTVDLASGIASVQGSASDESIISVITERGYTARRK